MSSASALKDKKEVQGEKTIIVDKMFDVDIDSTELSGSIETEIRQQMFSKCSRDNFMRIYWIASIGGFCFLLLLSLSKAYMNTKSDQRLFQVNIFDHENKPTDSISLAIPEVKKTNKPIRYFTAEKSLSLHRKKAKQDIRENGRLHFIRTCLASVKRFISRFFTEMLSILLLLFSIPQYHPIFQ